MCFLIYLHFDNIAFLVLANLGPPELRSGQNLISYLVRLQRTEWKLTYKKNRDKTVPSHIERVAMEPNNAERARRSYAKLYSKATAHRHIAP